jgi:hypothetical protein
MGNERCLAVTTQVPKSEQAGSLLNHWQHAACYDAVAISSVVTAKPQQTPLQFKHPSKLKLILTSSSCSSSSRSFLDAAEPVGLNP